MAKQRKANEREKKSKDKKKDENSGKKSKNWRMKKKGERDDKQDGLDDAEEEQVVVVPTGAKIEDVVEAVPEKVVEAVPVSSVEVKQLKKEKNKKKIEIQEVEIVPQPVEVVEAPPAPVEGSVVVEKEVEKETVTVVETVKSTNVKSSPTKQKNKKDKSVPTETATQSPKELLAVVKKTSFNDAEAQKLIDLLLTKQSGDALNTSDEWIEKGKPTETQKLKQELGELEEVLKEERMKNKSFTDKFSAMKRELNDERAAKANHNRIIDEIQKARQQEVSNINNRLQQVVTENNILQGNLQTEAALRREIEMNQGAYQASINSLSRELEIANAAMLQAKANDPHLLTELEQLRTLRDKYENSLTELNVNNSNLKNQISQQNDEISNIKKQLSSSSDKISNLSNSNSNLEKALAAKSDEAQKASVELKALKSKPEGPASAIINNNNINVAEIEAELASVKQKLTDKEKETSRLVEENERLSEQLASSVERPAAEGSEAGVVNGHSDSSSSTSSQSPDWRDKFEVLQMEHEKILAKQKVLQSDFEAEVISYKSQVDTLKSKNNDLSSSLVREKKSSGDLLLRLFPSLASSNDLRKLEDEAKEALEALGRNEAQVAHYKSVLAQTETMLTTLQSSVEAAEADWRLKLEVANKELAELRTDKSSPHISNQMQVQLSQLQQKLAKEEEVKETVSKENQELKQTSQERDKEVERLSKELSEAKTNYEELSKQVKEMKVTNNSLKELVSTSQEALSKEQNIVKCFQDQVPSTKVENGQQAEETVH